MENYSGLIVNDFVTPADGHAERNAAFAITEAQVRRPVRVTLGADMGYEARVFVNEVRSMSVRPDVEQTT